MKKKTGIHSKNQSLKAGEDTSLGNSTCFKNKEHKLSTHCTNYSLHLVTEKHHKQKKHNEQKVKKKTTHRGVNSKSSKNLKSIEIPSKKKSQLSIDEISYREYCLVEQSFLPLVNKQQQQHLQQLIECELSTCLPSKIDLPAEEKLFRRTKSKLPFSKKSFRDFEAQVRPECAEMGIQYSQRQEEKPQEQSPQKQQQEDDSLSGLLLKLQFRHLPDETSFHDLSRCEKEHYSQLLSSVLEKMVVSPRSHTSLSLSSNSKEQLKMQRSPRDMDAAPNLNEKMEVALYRRECEQMNWIESSRRSINQESNLNTSLHQILNYLFNLFCYIELQYTQEFLTNLRRMFGMRYKERYLCCVKGLPASNEYKKDKVLDQRLFLQFSQEIVQENESQLHVIHQKAVFDLVNEILDTYRPFYQNNGESFPWSVKMFKTISEYALDEDSLEIIFTQVKEKITETVSLLCGIIVEENCPQQLLDLKRKEREDRDVLDWLKEADDYSSDIQLHATKAFNSVAEMLADHLLTEVAKDLMFFQV